MSAKLSHTKAMASLSAYKQFGMVLVEQKVEQKGADEEKELLIVKKENVEETINVKKSTIFLAGQLFLLTILGNFSGCQNKSIILFFAGFFLIIKYTAISKQNVTLETGQLKSNFPGKVSKAVNSRPIIGSYTVH